MCRLFGSRSRVPGGFAHELLHGSNALRVQSREHPDGWGLGWYEGRTPRVVRSLTPAHGDAQFEQLSSFLNAETVVAHVRRASVGRISYENTHPFRRGPWLFAHNGTLPGWDGVRAALEERIDPSLRAELEGETDSERCFHLFLSRLRRRCDLDEADVPSALAALGETVAAVRELVDPVAGAASSTTFLATDGRIMVACRRGRTLHVSSPDPDAEGRVPFVAVASEDPTGDAPPAGRFRWRSLPEGALLGIDAELRLSVAALS
jgi:predicted glutamine amidotransferase